MAKSLSKEALSGQPVHDLDGVDQLYALLGQQEIPTRVDLHAQGVRDGLTILCPVLPKLTVEGETWRFRKPHQLNGMDFQLLRQYSEAQCM